MVKKKHKQILNGWPPIPESIDDDLKKAYGGFDTNSPRATIIIIAAQIDNELEKLLRDYLRSQSNGEATEDDLDFLLTSQPIPPLGSMAVRAKMARVLGLIPKGVGAVIEKIAKMRNVYAHSQHTIPLTSDTINALYDALPEPYQSSAKGFRRLLVEEPNNGRQRQPWDSIWPLSWALLATVHFALSRLENQKLFEQRRNRKSDGEKTKTKAAHEKQERP